MLKTFKRILLSIAIICSAITPLHATSYVLPESGDLIGELKTVYANSGETLDEVGRRFDIGFNEMTRANPRIDPTVRLFGTNKVVIPAQFILPLGPRKGIVINLAELRLYYYPLDDNVVITEPVGIGRKGWNTPIGTTTIVRKQLAPVWRPTVNVRVEAAKNGTPIPSAFPPGPNNPLGKYVLRLGWPTYLIHGTNRPEGVGARVSAGCIRMLPEDIEGLYQLVKVGTPVRVVNAPYKLGWQDGHWYLEVHKPLKAEKEPLIDQIKQQLTNEAGGVSINWRTIERSVKVMSGTPVSIS